MPSWYTPSSINAEVWKNAPEGDELEQLLAAAKAQCIAFAPKLSNPDEVPENYRLAHLLQAKALFNAQQGPSVSDVYGDGEAGGVRVYEMGATIRRLLRPLSGFPAVG